MARVGRTIEESFRLLAETKKASYGWLAFAITLALILVTLWR